MITVRQRGPHQMNEFCWCGPAIVEHMTEGMIIAHNDEIGVHLGTHPVLYAEGLKPKKTRKGKGY